jgi:hypothetical protein
MAPPRQCFNKFNQVAKDLVSRQEPPISRKERADIAREEAQATEPSTTSELGSDLTGDYTVELAKTA